MLARRVSMTPGEVVAFLASRQITVDDSANARLDEAHVRLVLERFAPAELTKLEAPAREVTDNSEVNQPVSEPHPSPEPLSTDPEGIATNPDEEGSSLPDVIKAPKVELPGLRVLGKIELPEPRKKETAAQENPEGEPGKPENQPRPRLEKGRDKGKNRGTLPRKNPVAMQREREAREAQEKRAQELENLKKKKTEYYLKRVKKIHQPTKSARLVEEATETLTDTRPQPTSLVGRLWRWLTS